jgi:RimJ/RimL family protein N-acetyltransferase
MTILQTDRLTLAPCVLDDAADFIALERDPEVMRYLNGGQSVESKLPDPDATFLMPRGTESHVWTARRTSGGAFVGWFCLWPEDEKLAELGYRLRRAEWGKGLASEGAAALVNWGFRIAGYEWIVASTMAANTGSRRVMEKIGMSLLRTDPPDSPNPFPGAEQGEVWYELARPQ